MHYRKLLLAFASSALALGAGAMTGAAADPVVQQIDEARVRIIDYSGKPPFRRQIVPIDALSGAQLARLRERSAPAAIDRARIGERVRVVDYRGKPPFSRKTVLITEANAARFARVEERAEREPSRRRGPFGKTPPFGR